MLTNKGCLTPNPSHCVGCCCLSYGSSQWRAMPVTSCRFPQCSSSSAVSSYIFFFYGDIKIKQTLVSMQVDQMTPSAVSTSPQALVPVQVDQMMLSADQYLSAAKWKVQKKYRRASEHFQQQALVTHLCLLCCLGNLFQRQSDFPTFSHPLRFQTFYLFTFWISVCVSFQGALSWLHIRLNPICRKLPNAHL